MQHNQNFSLAFVNSLIFKIPKVIENVYLSENGLVLVTSRNYIEFLLNYLKKDVSIQCNILIDLTAVDRLSNQEKRFEIYYFLRSTVYNYFITVKLKNDPYASIPSATKIYSSAGWLEREVWDMFGIFFSNHDDLRRILTDYGFQGFPLRKDFPLTGFIEVRYNDEMKRVTYEPIELAQEFRFFDFQSPWQHSEFIPRS